MTNELIIDKDYCMSAFLRYRLISNKKYCWEKNIKPFKYTYENLQSIPVKNYSDIDKAIKDVLKERFKEHKTGIMLSGGMDSAILATYMPEGTLAYTMRCVAKDSVNEVEYAKRFADINKLDLRIVDITWDDMKRVSIPLMKKLKCPFHSIEPLIYRLCEDAKKDNLEKLVCGETADIRFGGLDGLLSKDWSFEEFKKRYTFCEPSKVLKNSIDIDDDIKPYEKSGKIDVHAFLNEYFTIESAMNDYLNPATLNGIELIMPYALMRLDTELDLDRIRRGENKYLIRELFKIRYNGLEPNKKLPMPRAVGVWLKDWQGPTRPEFKQIDINEFKPDQKWLMFILEDFLNRLDAGEFNE